MPAHSVFVSSCTKCKKVVLLCNHLGSWLLCCIDLMAAHFRFFKKQRKITKYKLLYCQMLYLEKIQKTEILFVLPFNGIIHPKFQNCEVIFNIILFHFLLWRSLNVWKIPYIPSRRLSKLSSILPHLPQLATSKSNPHYT